MCKRLFVVVVILFVLPLSHLSFFPLLVSAQAGDDWPMLMHDSAHSGHTAATLDIADGLHLQWKFSFGERVEVEVQPMVANGRVYVGVMNGKMYCLDALTGAQEWVYQAGGPIPHTAAVAGGRVYFGALDGKVYALDVLSGEVAWTYQTDGPVYSAPAVVDGTVFIGSLDGSLYALDAGSGDLHWRYQTEGQVDTSPAVGAGRVYFGSEDMYAYCVRASDGWLVWKKKLSGYGMRNTYPMLAPESNIVIFVTTKPGASSNVPMEGYPDAPEGSDFRETWLQFYRDHPARRYLFYLDMETGTDKWTEQGEGLHYQPLPIPYWGVIIPILDGGDNAWFPVPSGVYGYKSTLDHDHRLVKVDLQTGLAVQVAGRADFQVPTSEAGRHTMIGDKYFSTYGENVTVYDPTTNTKQGLFGDIWTHMDPLDPLPTKHLWRYGGVIAMGGVPNGSPLVAAGGLGYYVSYGWLYCIGPEETTPPQVTPRSNLVEPYWPSAITAAEVRAELASRVAQIVAAGHLSPTARFVQAGYDHGLNRGYARPFQTFWFEGELVRSLVEALPFLPPALQSQTQDYMRTEAQAYLFNPSEYESRQDSLAYDDSLRTYWHAHGENLIAERLYAMWAYAYHTGDWTLVEANWAFIQGLFNKFASTFSEELGFCQFAGWRVGYLLDLNQQIGGMLGLSRMAAHVGDTAIEAQANYMLERMYAARVELGHYVQRLYDSGVLERVEIRLEPDGRLNNDDIMTYYNNPNETIPYREYRDRDSDIRQVVWWGDGGEDVLYYSGLGGADHYAVMVEYVPMYPEVADLLRTHLLAESQEYVDTYVMNDPWWWLNDLSHSKVGNAESLYEGPALSFSIFQTKAYVLQESFEELSRQLPLPYANVGHRDLYRLQNLVALLRALPQASKSVSTSTAGTGDVLTYTVSLQGRGTMAIITDTIPTGTTYVPNSARVEPQLGTLVEPQLGTLLTDLIYWTGVLTEYTPFDLTFAVTVTVTEPLVIVNTAVVNLGEESCELTVATVANGLKVYLPCVLKGW